MKTDSKTASKKFIKCTKFDEYKNPIGWWRVGTELWDETGMKILGLFYGDITKILAKLREMKKWNFFVTKFKEVDFDADVETEYEVNNLPIYIEWDNRDVDVSGYDVLKEWFPENKKYYVEKDGTSKSAGRIFYGVDAKTHRENERKTKINAALRKLTKEEKKLLGLDEFKV